LATDGSEKQGYAPPSEGASGEEAQTMTKELWATYSVNDHLHPRRFAADVMLYDRLVFPVPETGSPPPYVPGAQNNPPAIWTRNDAEWARWKCKGWDPEAQEDLLRLLNPVVRKTAWSDAGPLAADYKLEAARLAADQVFDYAFQATRTLLTQGLPSYVDGVAGMGPAYGDYETFATAGRPDVAAPGSLPGRVLADVLAAEFYVPDVEDPKVSTHDLLSRTVDFVGETEGFKERRSAYVEWQQGFLKEGRTDAASIQKSVEEMRGLVRATNEATRKLKLRKIARNGFVIVPSLLGLGDVLVGGAGHPFAVGGVFAAMGAVWVDEKLFAKAEVGRAPPVAFIQDARRCLGWAETEPGERYPGWLSLLPRRLIPRFTGRRSIAG
jgi:hypothetical protein